MDDQDRKLITENIEELIALTNYTRLIQKCRAKRMLSDVMQREIEKTLDPDERHRKLFEKITRRGPTAFDTLLSILLEESMNEAYKVLKPSYAGTFTSVKTGAIECNNNSSGAISSYADRDELDCGASITLSPFIGTVERQIEVRKAAMFGKHQKLPVYSMRSRRRGVLFLVNIITFQGDYDGKLRRNGAEQDRDNLIGLFQAIGGFTIFYYENITQEQFSKLLDELIKSSYLRTTDCLVMGILTHGSHTDGVTRILFEDMSYMKLEDVMERFQNKNCIHLLGKPKIFLFPFCRGDISDHGSYVTNTPQPIPPRRIEHDAVRDVKAEEKWPTYSDILICYATVVGFMTHRDVENGSWYIQNMVSLWAEHAHDTHVEELVKMVGLETMKLRSGPRQSLQTDSTESKGFHKLLYLNPGLVADD